MNVMAMPGDPGRDRMNEENGPMYAYDHPQSVESTARPVWIVDDDRSIRWVLEKALAREGLAYKTFASAFEVLQALALSQPQVLVSDIRMPGESGLALLTEVKERHPQVPIIIMTAYSDLDSAVAAFQGGAFEYLPKPFDVDHALALIRRADCAPVNAPRSWPNSSDSSRSFGIAAVLIATNGPAARGLWRCSARATSSLPVPDSPVMSTVAVDCDRRPIARNTSCIAGAWPRISGDSPGAATAAGAWRASTAARRISASA